MACRLPSDDRDQSLVLAVVKSVLTFRGYLDPTTMSGSTQPVAQTWRAAEPRYPPHGISYPVQIARSHTDVGLLEYQHHPRDYASHLSPGSIIQPQRRRPSLLSEFQPGSERSQELHLRPESRTFLPELGKPDIEFTESKRPRLELLPDTLLRPSPLLATGQPSGTEDLTKVHPS
ncbi:hypothetical protein U0070_019183 [Myodes glareolus]|uniref:Uncharacterized protein n=1 Tax=Myodes glareolus TaxID=447135 RepID=A0AAW0GX94_MYOGA